MSIVSKVANRHHPLYQLYYSMRTRCTNPNAPNFRFYGGRGIGICRRWLESFESFVADMGERPSKQHTLDRINNDGDYEPGNCRWANVYEQNRNRKDNTRVVYRGKEMILVEAVELAGVVGYDRVCQRLASGWPLERALETKPRWNSQ